VLTNAAPYAKYFLPNSSKIAMRYVANAQNNRVGTKIPSELSEFMDYSLFQLGFVHLLLA
jgi:hypothetical protein